MSYGVGSERPKPATELERLVPSYKIAAKNLFAPTNLRPVFLNYLIPLLQTPP
jgi:hypothetical protein